MAAVAPCVHADLILPKLSPGTQYRVAFVTSGKRNARSTNIQDYHDFVATQANTEAVLAGLGTNWYAIAATSAAPSARTNSMTTGTGVPIFLLDGGGVLADNYDDLWDGSLDRPFAVNQSGVGVSESPWTGSLADGTGHDGRPLGARLSKRGGGRTDFRWVDFSFGGSNVFRSFYGISGTLTASAAVPEPSSFALLGLGGIGFLIKRRRRARLIEQSE